MEWDEVVTTTVMTQRQLGTREEREGTGGVEGPTRRAVCDAAPRGESSFQKGGLGRRTRVLRKISAVSAGAAADGLSLCVCV